MAELVVIFFRMGLCPGFSAQEALDAKIPKARRGSRRSGHWMISEFRQTWMRTARAVVEIMITAVKVYPINY